MSKNEKARSTAATVKRAEAAAFSGAAASFYRDFTTPTNARQVSDILPRGAANAVDGQTLAAAMGFKSVRELSKQVERERRAGQPICASVSGECRGYFMGDPNELWLYLRSLDCRLREVRRTRDACEDTLRRMTGQEVLKGW
jgi:hypothetical protein